MRETAARFAANETVTVTATDFDRELAGTGHQFVTIEGDKAIWKNHWMAGGNEIKWDMAHYDVQLITRARLPKWQPAKARHWWLHCRYSCDRWRREACMW